MQSELKLSLLILEICLLLLANSDSHRTLTVVFRMCSYLAPSFGTGLPPGKEAVRDEEVRLFVVLPCKCQ